MRIITFIALLAASASAVFAQTPQGSIVGWGSHVVGVDLSQGFIAIASGWKHNLGLKADGSIVAWGNNDYGQTDVPAPNSGFVAVAAGYYHNLGLKGDGSIVAWGCNNPYYNFGQCSIPTPNTGFVAVAAGEAHSLGLKADGTILAWGFNYYGQTNVPAPNNGFVGVAAGFDRSLGLKADGSIVAWESDWNDLTSVPAPNSGFVAVAAGYAHNLGLKADGSIVAWGRNDHGQINVPAPNSDFVAVAAGAFHSLGLKADGSIVAWGDNGYGQINVPLPNTGFVAVAAGFVHSLGLKSDGSIVAWGRNTEGQTNLPALNTRPVSPLGNNGVEDTLQQVLDNHTVSGPGINAITDQTPFARFTNGSSSGAVATFVIELTAGSATQTFGIYDAADPSKKAQIFSGADTTGDQAIVSFMANGDIKVNFVTVATGFGSPADFGFYLGVGSGSPQTFRYSEDSLNVSGNPQALIYQGDDATVFDPDGPGGLAPGIFSYIGGEWIIAFEEDEYASSDKDFNDLVVIMESIQPVPGALRVVPHQRAVSQSGGSTTFAIPNGGSGTMNWTVAVTQGSPWLRITSGASGINGGIIFVAYDANPDPGPRTGTIRVSAPGSSPPYADVSVVQSGTAAPPTVTHFEFAPLPGPYMVDEPIPVTITAMNATTTAASQAVATFNGDIWFSTNAPCIPSPMKAQMQNGFWSGTVKCGKPFFDAKLKASSGGIFGESIPFTLTEPTGATGCIAGHVTAEFGFNPTGGFVSTLDLNGTPIGQATIEGPTSENFLPHYRICALPPGFYGLQAEKGGRLSLVRSARAVAGQTMSVDLQLDETTRRPVLLVPGFPGSTVRGQFIYARFESAALADPGDLKLVDPVGHLWGTLKGTLSPNFRVIDVPWDWRSINANIVEKYLIPAIDDAKRQCNPPCDKVNIVAHSAGGILVRSYIQSDIYSTRNDIDRFAMCGTPNRGAPLLYYIWEGGDPKRVDTIQGGFFPPSFYWNTFANLYSAVYNRSPGEVPGASAESTPAYLYTIAPSDIRSFLAQFAPIAGQLLPVYPFLQPQNSVHLQAPQGYTNSLLWNLNEGNPFKWRFADENNTDVTRIATKIFAGTFKNTVGEISVDSPGSGGLYEDGRPLDPPSKTKVGDGTVPWTSSVGPLLGYASYDDSKVAEHIRIMATYWYEICQFLNKGVPCNSLAVTASLSTNQVPNMLAVSISGHVQLMITTPGARRIGIDFGSGGLVSEVDGANIELLPSMAGISLDTPESGEYDLALLGNTGDISSVEIALVNEDQVEQSRVKVRHGDGSAHVRFALDVGASPQLAILEEVHSPAHVRSDRLGELTRVAWDATVDANVAAYNVYARPDDQPKYALLGSTTATTFDTGHPWNAGGAGQAWQYFVTAVSNDGKESFFTETVENRHPLIARIGAGVTCGLEPLSVAFTDASAGEVSAWAWDFDSDGVIDSTEPSPTHLFDTPGSYTVTLTVGGPEGTDAGIRVGFITVHLASGDVDGDRDVDFDDFNLLRGKLLGPGVDPVAVGWEVVDFDHDSDVDLRDFALFQNVFVRCP